MKPVHRCTCGCMMTIQKIKTPREIIVRYVCFRCMRTRRKFFKRSTHYALTLPIDDFMKVQS